MCLTIAFNYRVLYDTIRDAFLTARCTQSTSLRRASNLGSQHDASRSRSSGVRKPVRGVDRYPLPAPELSSKQPHAAAAVDRRDRQTDGRTDADRYIDFTAHTMRAASIYRFRCVHTNNAQFTPPDPTRRDETVLSRRIITIMF